MRSTRHYAKRNKKRKKKKRQLKKINKVTQSRSNKIDTARSYVKNLSKITLTDDEILVLSKNLKFVPTPSPPTTRELIKDFDDFAQRMRTKLWAYETKKCRKMELFTTRERKKTDTPSQNVSLENYLTATKIELANLHNKRRLNEQTMVKNALRNIHKNRRFKKRVNGNFSRRLKQVLCKLQKNNDMIIKKSDKGNCTVVIDKEQYVKEGMRQLQSCAHYMEMEDDITSDVSKWVNSTLLELLSNGEITNSQFKYLSPTENKDIKTAELYLLNKIHSDPPTKARPIISANNCPVERISEFVDFFLQPFVIKQHTYIKDTSDFIRKVEQIHVPAGALIITLDYESMYTNIVHEEAITAVRKTIINDNQYTTVNGLKRPSIQSFCKLIELAVKCNNFKFNGRNFYQCRGVAMGHKASPAICDIVIYYLEEKILALSDGKIFTWLRFRDDVFAIYTGNETEAISFLEKANKMHPTLKFKYNMSQTYGIFLDTVVFKGKRFSKENILDFKPYVKPSEKFQYIHRQSSHPHSVFHGLIKGELIRFVRTATNTEDYTERANLFKEKLLLRGYSEEEFSKAFKQVSHRKRDLYLEENKNKRNKKPIPLVFTTTFNPHIRGFYPALMKNWEIIQKSEYLSKIFTNKPTIAFRRAKNLRDSLVRARLRSDKKDTNEQSTEDLDLLISLLAKDPDADIQCQI